MRRITTLLSEIRSEQLKNQNASPERIAEAIAYFSEFDNLLTGMRHDGYVSDRLAETMTSADFTYAIMEFVQRLMIPAYTNKTFNFELFVKPETTPNFLPVTRYQRRSGLDDLEYVGEKGERRPGSSDDAVKRQFQVYRWGKQYDFSMEALVNDDLGYFQDFAALMGQAARRTLEKHVSNMLWNAVTTARLVALGANYSTTGRLTTARISTARMAFNSRLDNRNEPLNAKLAYIVYHPGLLDTVAQIQNSTLVPELETNAVNVVRGTFVGIEDPYAPGTAPDLPWFALTDWRTSNVVPFILARRAGMPGPMLMRKKSDIESITTILGAGTDVPPVMGDFATGNVVFAVEDQWGVFIDATDGNMFDPNGCYYSDGTAA